MNRRDYLQKILMGGSVLFLAPSVLQSCSKEDDDPDVIIKPGNTLEIDLTLAENAALNNPGGTRFTQGIMIANADTHFFAVSSTCTHEGCTVGYNLTAGKVQCPCHGSEYSTNGNVLTGPATRALQSFTVVKTGNILKITT